MFHSSTFIHELQAKGVDVYTGVPCSFLKPLINFAIDSPDISYIPLNNEGEALAYACGAYVAGRKPAVLFQNSGLGNLVNPLSSLAYPFRIPILLICSLRGQTGIKDEPQHALMGKVSSQMFSLLGVENELLSGDEDIMIASINRAFSHFILNSLPYGLLITKDAFQKYDLKSSPLKNIKPNRSPRKVISGNAQMSRYDVIRILCDAIGLKHVIVGTTGITGRELFSYRDSPNHFYMVGSMGCASSFALGLAVNLPRDQKVIVIDGDGSALMRLEAMASIGFFKPQNLIHILLDNNAHESTGGQQTLSGGIAFDSIAAACGYADAVSISTQNDFVKELGYALESDKLSFIHIPITLNSKPAPPRPTMLPHQVKERLMKYLSVKEKNV